MSSITRPSSGSGGMTTGYQLFQGVKEFQDGTIQTAATGADANTTLTTADRRHQFVTPTVNRVYTLPGTGIKAGECFVIYNGAAGNTTSDKRIEVKADDATSITFVYPNCVSIFRARIADPATSTDWFVLEHLDNNWYDFTPTVTMGGVDVSANLTTSLARFKRQKAQVFVEIRLIWSIANTQAGDLEIGLPLPNPYGSAAPGYNYYGPVSGLFQNSTGFYPIAPNYAGASSTSKTKFLSLRRNADPTYYGVGDGNVNSGPWGSLNDTLTASFDYESSGG